MRTIGYQGRTARVKERFILALVVLATTSTVSAQQTPKAADNYDELFQQYLASSRATAAAPVTADSLWMAGLSGDLRARRLNDLVTVRVVEVVSAQGSAD